MSSRLQGLFVPITTPFSEEGDVALDRLGDQIEIYASFDLAGVVVLGTSGEGPLIEPHEEAEILEVVRRAVPSGRAVIVQIGRESVRASVASADRAASAGADALLCLPPRYYATSEVVVERFYRQVAEGTDLPLLAYHIPHRSKVDLAASLLLTLARDGVIHGIKDSAGDLDLEAELRSEAGDGFSILSGKATTTTAAMDQGADGAILAVADAVPEVVLALLDARRAGDADRVDRINAGLAPLAEAFGVRFGVAGIKAALDLRGWPGGGSPRSPLRALGDDDRNAVADGLRQAGVEP